MPRSKLRGNADLFRLLAESSLTGVYLIQDNLFRYVNQAFALMFGYEIDEIVDRMGPMDLTAPEDRPLVLENIRKRIEGEVHDIRYSFQGVRKDENRIYIEVHGSTVRYRRKPAIIGTIIDITDRKLAEAEMARSASLLKATLESTADGILVVNMDGKIVSFNQKFLDMWNIPPSVISTRNHEEVLAFVFDQLKKPDEFYEKVKLLYANPESESFDLIEFKDGRSFERYSRPQRLEGKIVGRVWSFRDVTEMVEAERALRSAEAHYRQFFNDDLAGHYVSTPDGRVLICNNAFARIFGFSSPEEVKKIDVSTLYPIPVEREKFIKLLKEKRKIEHHETEYVRRDGKRIYVVENAVGEFGSDDRLVAIRGYIVDESERKKLQNQLFQSQRMESVGTIAGGVAHDFNNILGIILGHLPIMEKLRDNPDRFSKSLDAVTKAAKRGANLVKQLLTFARKVEVITESVRVNDIIIELCDFLRETFPKTITFSLELDDNLPSIHADPNQLHQVFLNLCVNARDAMPSGGKLRIATTKVAREVIKDEFPQGEAGEYVLITVSDTGIGMDRGTLTRIFEPFFTTKGRDRGSGLGLSVVYGIVKAHHGFIDVRSEVGKGTTFLLYFPIPPQVIGPVSSSFEQIREIRGGSETLLIVEDEEALQEFVKTVLEDNGYKVILAGNGKEAIETYRKNQEDIALILTDVGLPEMSGTELLLEIKRLNPFAKVIVASGYLEPEMKQGVLEAKADAFLQKPYLANELLMRIREVIDR
ncbi:MAG: hybrid sensor histidine kinase/response regulator [Candidatus Kryptoniota bacterium]